MVCRRPGIEWAVTVLHFGKKSRDSLGEHCRVWDCNTNTEWTSLGSALCLTHMLDFSIRKCFSSVSWYTNLISNQTNQPSRLTQVRCHQWRRKQDPPSPQSCKRNSQPWKSIMPGANEAGIFGRGRFQQGFGLSSASSWLNPAHLAF